MEHKEIDRSDPKFTDKLLEIRKRYFGTSGDPEAETILGASKIELKEGYFVLFSSNKDVSKFIERAPDKILAFKDYGHGVRLKIDKKALRGFHYCLKIDKEEGAEEEQLENIENV